MKGPVSARQGEPAARGSPVDMRPAVALSRAGPPRLDIGTTASELALVELRRLLAAWHVHEPGARLGRDPEALHQLRVTARRIDATLALFSQQLPLALSHARRPAKTVLRTLGAARDLDVQLAQLARYCDGLPENERTAAEPLDARLEAERVRARARMIRALDCEPTRRWLGTLGLASVQASTGDGAFAERATMVMPERIRSRFRKLRKSVRRLGPESSMEDYHAVRRRAKQLRYAIESGAGLFGNPAQETLKALRRLQGAQRRARPACPGGRGRHHRHPPGACAGAASAPDQALTLRTRAHGAAARPTRHRLRTQPPALAGRCAAPAVAPGRDACPHGGAGTEAHHATAGAGAGEPAAPRTADCGDPHPVRRVAQGRRGRAAAARRSSRGAAGAAGTQSG